MDDQRFDAIAKTLAKGLTRRRAVGRLAGGGLAAATLAAVGAGRGAARAVHQEATPEDTAFAMPEDVCAIAFEATVRQGPSAGQEYRGLLVLPIEEDGGIAQGALIPRNAPLVEVVGQATGRAVNLLFTVGDGQHLYGVGVAETPLGPGRCEGQMGGPFVGPMLGDAGDWITCDCATNPDCSLCAEPLPDPQVCGVAACQIGCAGLPAAEYSACLAGCRRMPLCP